MGDKIKNIIISIIFFTVFIGVFFLNVLSKDKNISNTERRGLRHFPKITWNNIIDTKVMNDFDKYVLDQFILRDLFRGIKTHIELDFFNKKDNNNLFIKNQYIFKNLYPLNEKSVKTTADKMNSIYKMYLNNMSVYYTIIPDKSYYLKDESGYLKIDYNKLVSIMNNNVKNMKYIDIFDTLSLESYYKTDIHWRQDKLYDTALKISKNMMFNITNKYDKKVIKDFKGSYFGQIALSNISSDNITYLTNNMLNQATVFNYETNKYSSIYDLTKIRNIDKYDVFLSGPAAILDIDNQESLSDKELIIFRDSFGSSLIPLLIQDYKKITVIDIRYVSSDYLSKVIKFNNQDVLFMYSVNVINNGILLK